MTEQKLEPAQNPPPPHPARQAVKPPRHKPKPKPRVRITKQHRVIKPTLCAR